MYRILLSLVALAALAAPASAYVVELKTAYTAAAQGPSIDSLHWDDNYTAGFSAPTEVRIFEETTGTEKLDGLTNVANATGNTFTTIANGEYTTDSNHGTSSSLLKDDNLDTPHYSTDGSTAMNFYAEWSAAFNLDYIDIYVDDGVTYGDSMLNVDFEDEAATSLTKISYPLHKDDYVSIPSGNTRQYRFKFIDDGVSGTLSATYEIASPATGYDLTETLPYRYRDNDDSSKYTCGATASGGFIVMDFGSSVSVNNVYILPCDDGAYGAGFSGNDRQISTSTDAACGDGTTGSWSIIETVAGTPTAGVAQDYAVSDTVRCIRFGRAGYISAVGDFYAN